MKKASLLIAGTVMAFGIVGCAVKTTPDLPISLQPKVVTEDYAKYGMYYKSGYGNGTQIYNNHWKDILAPKLTDGLLECNLGDLIEVTHLGKYIKFQKNYESKLTNEEYKRWTHGKELIKTDSKEFQKWKAFVIKEIKDGYIACTPPMSRQEVQAYLYKKAQQERINNDPNVIAAKYNYAAAQAASHKTITIKKNVNHSGYINTYGNYSIYNY